MAGLLDRILADIRPGVALLRCMSCSSSACDKHAGVAAQCPVVGEQLGEQSRAALGIGEHDERETPIGHLEESGVLTAEVATMLDGADSFPGRPQHPGDTHAASSRNRVPPGPGCERMASTDLPPRMGLNFRGEVPSDAYRSYSATLLVPGPKTGR